jgi:hypothetical protein
MQASEVCIGRGPEILTNIERRELVTEQVGRDEIRCDLGGQVLPVAVYADCAGEGILAVWDGEQGNHVEHSGCFFRVGGATGGSDAATEANVNGGSREGKCG